MSETPLPPDYDLALYIDEPYASYIKQGIQTLYVDVEPLPRETLESALILVGAKAYGTITFDLYTKGLGQEDFNAQRDAHRIDIVKQAEYARERPAWLNGPFYAYTFKFIPFPTPLDYEDYEEVEKKCSGKRRIKKLTVPVIKSECAECHKDPCECKKPCPDCGKEPCECPDDDVEKSMVPDITENPSAYEVILNKVPDGWTLHGERHPNHFIVLMKHTENAITKTKIHAILFDKTLCPCAIAKMDYTPYTLWTSTVYNAEHPLIPSDIPLKG